MADDLLAAADQARLHAEWERARALYARALTADPDDPRALDGLGMTAWWLTGRWKDTIDLRSRAYSAFRRRGDHRRAAGIAVALAEECRIEGLDAAGRGWLARAARLLEREGECSEHGWLAVERAKRSDSAAERQTHAGRALALAERLRDGDLEVAALAHLGLARTMAGDVQGGMEVLDEAMAAAMAGEATDPLAMGEACCMTLVACDRLADFERGSECCRVVAEFAERRNFTPLAAWCRTIYASFLLRLGEWQRAEQELVAALAGYERLGGGRRVQALAALAELRLLQGRLEDAERLLEGHVDDPSAGPAPAMLALEQGQLEVAAVRVAERLERLPETDPAHASSLAVLAEVRLRQGDLDEADAVAGRVGALGRRLALDHLSALAELAAGRIAGARGDEAASAHLREALRGFAALGMPFEEARARLALARHHAADRPTLCVSEARSALAIFQRLGAARDADAAADLLRSLGAAGRTGEPSRGALTRREIDVLELLAAGLSNPEIGRRLFITTKTVEHHVGRILTKLGARNRTEAAARHLRGEGDPARRGMPPAPVA